MSWGVYSEVGKLRTVMVHRPGIEHRRLTPTNAHELVPYERKLKIGAVS